MPCKVGYIDPRPLARGTPEQHPFFRPERLLLAHSLFESLGLLSAEVKCIVPESSEEDELLLFHKRSYLEFVKGAPKLGLEYLDSGDTPAFEGVFENSSLRVGGALQLLSMIDDGEIEHGIHVGGGLHHAYPDHASGFCVFNDIGVCISKLESQMGIERIAYVDIDAHHGDGVFYNFYNDPRLLCIDIHEDGRYLFPGSGYPNEIGDGEARGLKVNVPLPPGASDKSFLYAFNELVPPLIRSFRPSYILFVCGCDAHAGDPITELYLTTDSYRIASKTLHSLAHEFAQGRIVAFGGGGYNIANSARCWSIVLSDLLGFDLDGQLPRAWVEEVRSRLGIGPGRTILDLAGTVTEAESIFRQSEKVVKQVRDLVFPLNDLKS